MMALVDRPEPKYVRQLRQINDRTLAVRCRARHERVQIVERRQKRLDLAVRGRCVSFSRLRIDLQRDHATAIESLTQCVVRQGAEKVMERAHLTGGQSADRAVTSVFIPKLHAA